MFSYLSTAISTAASTTAFITFGTLNFTNRAYERLSSQFKPIKCSNSTEKVAIVTGANSGIGKEVAKQLVSFGVQVHMVCRSKERGMAALEEIKQHATDGGSNVHLHIADMSSPGSIKTFVQEFTSHQSRLDILVNNAGILPSERVYTADGLESTFATNTFGPYLLTRLFIPLMEKTAFSKNTSPRVITVASGGAYTAHVDPNLHKWTNKHESPSTTPTFDGASVYAQSKRQEIVMMHQMAKQYNPTILFFSVHPGWADTPGVRTSIPQFYSTFQKLFRSVEQGSDGVVWLAAADEVGQDSHGGFWLDRRVQPMHLPLAGTQETLEEAEEFMRQLDQMASQYL